MVRLLQFFCTLITIILISGCGYTPIHVSEVQFHEPTTWGEKFLYQRTKNTLLSAIEESFAPNAHALSGYKRVLDQAEEFFLDLGAVQITSDGVQGFYFDPARFEERQVEAFKKWRKLFASARYCKLAEIFEVDFNSRNILTLVSMPAGIRAKGQPKSVLCIPSFDFPALFDPKWILSYLARGMHLFVMNDNKIYAKYADWESKCLHAKAASLWLQKKTSLPLIIAGKSLGTGPAIYAAAESPGASLILEKSFSRMNDIDIKDSLPFWARVSAPFAEWVVEKFYRFPNEDWIKRVKGKILLIESLHEPKLHSHVEKLTAASNQPQILQVSGNHFSHYWEKNDTTWYSNEKDQQRLDQCLQHL